MLYFSLSRAFGWVNGWLLAILLLAACTGQPERAQDLPPLTAEQLRDPAFAVRGLKVRTGLEAALYASEPLLTNPTNMDIDEKGRIWITEAYNYRYELNPGHPVKQQGDRIIILEDTDGDGRADTSKVFYQDTTINAALGIAVLGNKVIVSCSPNVFIFTDENGDDKADKKELLFQGIGGRQHDHAIHAFTFGPDGKLYFNFGNAGDSILDRNGRLVRDPEGHPVNGSGQPYRQGMVFRCNPDGSGMEVLAHNFRNNYEVAVDAFGNLWQSDNDDDGNRGVRINYVMEYGNYGYTDEMTGAGWRSRRVNMEDSIPFRHWHLNDPGVVPNLLQTGSGSPTGMLVYEGELLPEIFQGQMIHGEPGHNIVRAYPVTPEGAGYTAAIEPVVEGEADKWFRPSDVCVAPDGSLFVADWYDPGVGGHQVGDLDKGRVFRIAPADSRYKIKAPVLRTANDAIDALKSPNVSTRYLAWTKLHELGATAEKPLQEMYAHRNPRYRARALWLLSKLPEKGPAYARQALQDQDEDIRITAIHALRQLPVDRIPLLQALVNDTSVRVRRELIIALRHVTDAAMPALWAQLARQYDGRDRWYLEALGIGADANWDACFNAWLQQNGGQWNTPAGRDIVWRARCAAALPLLVQIIEDPAGDPLQQLKFFRAFDFYPDSLRQPALLGMLKESHPRQDLINALIFIQLNTKGLRRTPALQQSLRRSLAAVKGQDLFIDLVERYGLKDQNDALMQIALQHPKDEVRGNAMKCLLASGGQRLVKTAIGKDTAMAMQLVKAISRSEDKQHKDLLQTLALNKALSLPVRVAATRGLARGWNGYDRLWSLVEQRRLPAELDTTVKNILINAWRPDIRTKAVAFYEPAAAGSSRLLPVKELALLKGAVPNGRKVFATYCAVCHVAGNTGTNFGPALSEIGSKLTKEALYDAIINPDAGINFGYEGYTLKLKDGNEVLGYIAGETKDEIEVKMAGGAGARYKRSDIISRKPYGHSLMPAGLATGMPQQDLVDLVEFLTSLKK